MDQHQGVIAVSSHAADPARAIAEIADAIAGAELAGGLLFCSHRFPRERLGTAIGERLGGLPLIGCTSAGELTARGYDTDSVLFIGFPAELFTMQVLHFTDLDGFDREDARRQIRHLAANARQESGHLGKELNQVGLFLVDGLSHREEVLTMTAQDALGDIQLIGGSSGDGLLFRETGVLYDGGLHQDAAVIAILTSSRPLHAFCANHYRPGPAKMVVTEANPESRVVYEINAAPAAEEYRRLAGNPTSSLDVGFFAAHPPMVRTGGTYHVRSIQTANPDGSLTFYCAVDRGIVLTIGEPVDRVAQMRQMFADIEQRIGEVDTIVGFDCVLNRIDAENRQLSGDVSRLYADHRVFGFNTYGEQFLGAHVNQTFSGLAIGR
ncbi:MAG: FIST C-terminal domain-containing protein [Sphingomonadales bacterium]|nr:FIST C-terminal domain-containing protein [Sphingomonadales bacterium]MBD3772631.1 FIST C-terminal domain-containing protein [Paracoccaceae bacterium]